MPAFVARRLPRLVAVKEWLIAAAVYAAIAWFTIQVAERLSDQSPLSAVALCVVGLATVLLLLNERWELSLLVLFLYIGLLDGFLRNLFGTDLFTVARNGLLGAMSVGALLRVATSGEPLRFPPLTGWVAAWTAAVLVQLWNPEGGTMKHSVLALRQHLEFVPLFFFGFVALRTTGRLRLFFLLLLGITAANGVVALVQYLAGPEAVAGWGPGFREKIYGSDTLAGRVFQGEGSGDFELRPFGLGSDVGFGGNLAMLAAPAALVLLAQSRSRAARAVTLALAGGVVLGLATSQARISVLGGVLAVVLVIGLTVTTRGAGSILLGLVVVAVVSFVAIDAIGGKAGGGIFDRYGSIGATKVVGTTTSYKQGTLALVPEYIEKFPLGTGLGVAGPASAQPGGGPLTGKVSAESSPNFLLAEVGLPGMLIILAFWIVLCAGGAVRVRRIDDGEARALLSAMIAALGALLILWLGAPVTTSPPTAPFFWLSAGVLAYWCFDPKGPAKPRSRFA